MAEYHPYDGPPRPRPKRAVTDYGSTTVQWMRNRKPRYKNALYSEVERPSASYIVDMAPPAARITNAAESIPAKALHSSLNKVKHPINVVKWTPDGRRLLTGSTSGEFTLWNGMGFNFETIMQAHESAIRGVAYTHTDDWLLSADQTGIIKYWQTNFNNVKEIQAHDQQAIRGLAIAPTDSKFVTASDDQTLKIWDFASSAEESTLTGHGWEVRTVDWHPTKGLLCSGSKDHTVKLWDPRTGRCLSTLRGHKNPIAKTLFEPVLGNMMATCARDHTARIFDLRMMRDVLLLRGHEKDVTTMSWHPMHKNLLSTGGVDGSIFHWLLDEQNAPAGVAPTISPYDSADPQNAPAQTIHPAHKLQYAHDFTVWTLDWHPLGHILASGSNDRVTRFWARPRPGDSSWTNDRYHIGTAAAEAQGTYDRGQGRRQMRDEEEQEAEDEAEGLVDQKMPSRNPGAPFLPPGLTLPGLNTSPDGTSSLLPGIGGAHPPPMGLPIHPPPPPNANFPPALPPGMDPQRLAQLIASGAIPPPPIPGANNSSAPPFPFPHGHPPPPPQSLPHGVPPPPFPQSSSGAPPPFPFPPPGMSGAPPPPPPNFPFPLPGMSGGPPLPGMPGAPQLPHPGQGNTPPQLQQSGGPVGGAGAFDASGRRRAPLPSQQDSLKAEMRKGNYRKAR